jgi:diguanylate cyclase (GGDEF)-like protein
VDRVRRAPRPPIVVASLAGPPASALERFAAFDAELYAVRPHSIETIGPLVHAAGLLGKSQRKVQALRSAEDRLRERLHEAGHSGKVRGFQLFLLLKRLLVLEIKRAKRYEYSVAVCVVAADPLDEPVPAPAIQDKLSRKVAAAITSSIRDIDIPVDYSDERMLLFLPYTDSAGAREVGERILKIVRSTVHTRDGDRRIRMSVSMGIAALRQGQELSFSRLMREANAALKAARLKGGNRVVCRD